MNCRGYWCCHVILYLLYMPSNQRQKTSGQTKFLFINKRGRDIVSSHTQNTPFNLPWQSCLCLLSILPPPRKKKKAYHHHMFLLICPPAPTVQECKRRSITYPALSMISRQQKLHIYRVPSGQEYKTLTWKQALHKLPC